MTVLGIRPIHYAIPIILSFPAVATLLTEGVNWAPGDFLIMGILLFLVVSLMDWVWRRRSGRGQRTAWIIVILILFLLVWAELAVGIFETPFAGN